MPPTEFQKPVTAAPTQPPTTDARIFTMPERYRHGAQAMMREPQKPSTPAPVSQVKAPMAPPRVPVAAIPSKSAKPSGRKRLLIVGAIVLVVLAVGGLVLVRLKQETPASVVQDRPAPTSRPAPRTEPEPVVEVEPEVEEPVVEPEPFATVVTPGVDTDSDGLTDVEETNVYKTNPRLPDTDADGFLDGNEVFHRYNPGGTAPGTLLESGLVARQAGEAQGVAYEFYAPTAWSVIQADGEWVMDAGTGAGVRIAFEAREAAQAFGAWVEERLETEGEVGKTKNGLAYMTSSDKLKLFIDLGPTVMMMVYDPGTRARVDYLQTMQMMANTVTILK